MSKIYANPLYFLCLAMHIFYGVNAEYNLTVHSLTKLQCTYMVVDQVNNGCQRSRKSIHRYIVHS